MCQNVPKRAILEQKKQQFAGGRARHTPLTPSHTSPSQRLYSASNFEPPICNPACAYGCYVAVYLDVNGEGYSGRHEGGYW